MFSLGVSALVCADGIVLNIVTDVVTLFHYNACRQYVEYVVLYFCRNKIQRLLMASKANRPDSLKQCGQILQTLIGDTDSSTWMNANMISFRFRH